MNAVAGVAAFADCQITGTAAAGNYTLSAARSGLTTGSSSNVSITAGAPPSWPSPPSRCGGVNEGTNFGTEPVVSVRGRQLQRGDHRHRDVALSVGTYAAGNGGTTRAPWGAQTTPVNAVAGVATFANCKMTGTKGAGTYTSKRGPQRAGHGELFERDHHRRNGGETRRYLEPGLALRVAPRT